MMSEVPSLQPDMRTSDDRDVSSESGPAVAALRPARLGRSLLAALRSVWERLGAVLLISLSGTALLLLSLLPGLILPAALPLAVRYLGIGLIVTILFSPFLAASYDAALRISTHREVTTPSFLQAVRQFGSVAIRLGLLHLAMILILVVNAGFYLQLSGIAGRAAALLCLYVGLVWSAMALYQGPLMVLQETGAFDEPDRPAKRGAKAVIRRSFFLVLGEPIFSFGLWMAILLWSAAATLTAVGTAMFWLGGVCILTTAPTLALLVKYGVIDPVEGEEAPPAEEA